MNKNLHCLKLGTFVEIENLMDKLRQNSTVKDNRVHSRAESPVPDINLKSNKKLYLQFSAKHAL